MLIDTPDPREQNRQPRTKTQFKGNKGPERSKVRLLNFSSNECTETLLTKLTEDDLIRPPNTIRWVQLEGLQETHIIETLSKHFNLHPLTQADILNPGQRPKVEEFDHYLYISLKILHWDQTKHSFYTDDLSIVIGEDFLLTFQDTSFSLFDLFKERLIKNFSQALRKTSPDYISYRLLDIVVDHYFNVLEALGDQMEKVQEMVIVNPKKQTLHALYHLKHQVVLLRKIIWPMRDVVSQLLHYEGKLISSFTRVFLRDVYDHAAQAIDTVETFREMLANILDIYLSTLSFRMNEIMKVLTIIMTTFIPISFIASIYGMNFKYMPELSWKWSYPIVLIIMVCIMFSMLFYYRYKKWW